ncbi:MAG: RluA family pseudouridine synthase [Pirellulales bacterium]|nr:RluA family pseudouridine synthase [Pirellulales bacterium]
MSRPQPIDVIYQDNHLLVVNKPAMLATMGVSDGAPSLLAAAREYIRLKYQKPGNVYLGVVSRLDAPVTGLVLLARTSKAAARLAAAFRSREVEKRYLAVVEGSPAPAAGLLEHYLRKDERHRKVHVTHAGHAEAQLARLEYRVVAASATASLLEIALETGRKHQIRVQLAKIGHAILGDRKYGSALPFHRGIALHAQRLVIEHPVRRHELRLEAALPPSWRSDPHASRFLGQLGG